MTYTKCPEFAAATITNVTTAAPPVSEPPAIPPFWDGESLASPSTASLRGDPIGPVGVGSACCVRDSTREVRIESDDERESGAAGVMGEIDGVKVDFSVGGDDVLKGVEVTERKNEEEG